MFIYIYTRIYLCGSIYKNICIRISKYMKIPLIVLSANQYVIEVECEYSLQRSDVLQSQFGTVEE